MEPSSIVLITAPILFPIAVSLGINPVHLGILMTVNMEVGLCHPPVGLNLYVASGIARMGITELTIATWPWLVTMLIFLVMVTYIPELSLWLPRCSGCCESFLRPREAETQGGDTLTLPFWPCISRLRGNERRTERS